MNKNYARINVIVIKVFFLLQLALDVLNDFTSVGPFSVSFVIIWYTVNILANIVYKVGKNSLWH